MGVPDLIGPAANNPTPLIADLRLCHSRFARCSLIPSSHSFIDRILLFATVMPRHCVIFRAYSTHFLSYRATMLAYPITLRFAAPCPDRRKPARNGLRFCNLGLQPLHERVEAAQ